MASTIKLNSTITWAKSFLSNLDVAVNTGNEPALTSANTILQTVVSPPFTWLWNRAVTGFICSAGVQDYVLTTWAASTAYKVGTLIVDSNGFSQQITTAGTTGNVTPTWNQSVTGTTTDGTVVWTNRGAVYQGSSTLSLGQIETVAIQDVSANLAAPKWYEIETQRVLSLDTSQARPRFISTHNDDGAGKYTFRLMPIPDQAYPVNITFQQKPTLMVSKNSLWSPIPDEMSYIFNWGFLTLMYLYIDDNRFAATNAKFVSALLGTQEGLTEMQRNIFLNNWQSVTGQPMSNAIKLQQGNQVRGM